MADDIKKLEERAGQSNADIEHEFEASRAPVRKKVNFTKGAALMTTATVLIVVVGIVGSIIFAPSLMLVNMKEQIANDLNDAGGAYYIFTHKVLGAQLGGDSCDDETINCKFKTMSNMLKDRFEDYGIDVKAEENSQGRFKSAKLTLPSGANISNENQLMETVKANNRDTYSLHNVITPRGGLYHDRKFPDRLHSRFHLEHKPSIYGYTRKEVGTAFGDSLKKHADYIDGNGQGVYGLHFLADGENKKFWKGIIRDRLMDKAKPTHLSLACSMYTYADLADDAVRRARAVTLARFAMQYLALADAIKSGNNANYEAAINILTDRLMVVNQDGKSAFDDSSFRVPAKLETISAGTLKSRNRDYMNDPGQIIKEIKEGNPSTQSLRNTIYPVAALAGVNSVEVYDLCGGGLSGVAASVEAKGPPTCSFPSAAAVASLVNPIVSAMYAARTSIACPPLEMVVKEVNQQIRDSVSSFLSDKIANSAKTDADYFTYLAAGVETTETSEIGLGIATQDAVFAGTGIILGDAAQSIGMRPASIESLQQYHKFLESGNETGSILSRAKTTDDKVQRFIAKIARSLYRRSDSSALAISPHNTVIGMLTLGARALSSIGNTTVNAAYSQPIDISKERFLTMSDCNLESGDFINPDFGCNVRYSMSKEDMNISISEMVDYMTKEHPDEAQESLNEINSRDMQVGGEEASRMKKEAEEGAKAAYVDPKTGKPNPHTQYAKFLEFCANRRDPWGSIGLAMEYQDEKYTPDAEDTTREGSPRTYSGQYIKYMDKDPNKEENQEDEEKEELPDAYYGRAWGSTVDQAWMTGEKCTEESKMMNNFRAYTISCRILASFSGARECWHHDSNPTFNSGFYARNDIFFTREN